jgi:hypothetical protein
MKKFGIATLAVLSAFSLTALTVGCSEKKKDTTPPKQTPEKPATPPAEKPAGGAH